MSREHLVRTVANTIGTVGLRFNMTDKQPSDLYHAMAEHLADAQLLQSPETAAEAEPLAWAEQLDETSLGNFLHTLGMAADLRPVDGALAQVREVIRSFREALPAGAERKRARTLLDHARDALNARMTKDNLRLVLENVITHAAALQDRAAELEENLRAVNAGWGVARTRVTELEVAAVEGRAALAALCHDLDDPGSMALGALYLLQQATPGTPMEPGETVPKVYRASHDSLVMGLYTTAAAARAHCEADMRRDLPSVSLDWIEDEEDGVAELVAAVGEEERSTGFVVTALEIASKYDEEADE
ncbi:hypothetical protein G3M58_10665 [Streptomyces sp. SID7499]|uniref:Uncharacterized protein n=1 Tax=Streptomyces sp. SID7499 TaxID=2706086 RepID=A0A6G3WN81_9ACTN|nr:hypothetical protein [Streptomyces sp. SID7499]